MADTNEQQNQQDAPSIGQLRDMIMGKPPATNAQGETPAASGENTAEARTEPESGTEQAQADEQDTERGEDGKFKTSPGVQKRIDKAVKAQRDAERKVQELEARLAANQGSRPGETAAKPEATNAQTPPAAKAKPDAKDFDSYESYVEALTDWKLEVREAKRAQEQAESATREAQRKTAESHAQRVEKAKERYQDWDEIMASASSMPITREIHMAITETEHGPDIAYHLATHPEEVRRIAALPPVRQIAELGKLEAKFEKPANAATNQQQQKRLPKPPANVGGSAGAKNLDLADPQIDMSTFKRLARAQLRRN